MAEKICSLKKRGSSGGTTYIDWSTSSPQAVNGNVYVAMNRNGNPSVLKVNGVALTPIKRRTGVISGETIYFDCYFIENLKTTDTLSITGNAYAYY